MKSIPLALIFVATTVAAAPNPVHHYTPAEQRKSLERVLCADKALDCPYVEELFRDADFRDADFTPTPSVPPPAQPVASYHRERNPYMTERFGLLTPESLERCHDFIEAHQSAFDAAQVIYDVPKEIICGHLRIETNFGIVTRLTPHPLGTAPAFNRLVLFYVRNPRRRKFALQQLEDLISEAEANHWDLLAIPGSATGAIGLLQFEPSNFYIAVDGNGDGTIDLFSPEDATLSLAHFLATHGWNNKEKNQERAIYSYYGRDPHKYYMKAVLAYAAAEKEYLVEHPILAPPFIVPDLSTWDKIDEKEDQ